MSRTQKIRNHTAVPMRISGGRTTSRPGRGGGGGSDFCVLVGDSGSISDATSGRLPRMVATTRKTGGLNRFFKISERGSTPAREIRGGLVTFVTMAYIVVL